MTVADILARYLPAIDAGLRDVCRDPADGLGPMIRYHLGWQDADGNAAHVPTGKRLRPAVVLLTAEALGNRDGALPAAIAVELLHNFSLIHDDIQDDSPVRHGRPTVWKVWGMAQAINAGDALHVLAQRTLIGAADVLPAARAFAQLRAFADASLTLCQGQYLDLSFETRDQVSESEYLAMIGGKTAALLACCFELGAIAGSDDPDTWAAYRAIGDDLGLAFQIWDDYLGTWGDSAVTGKPVAEDISNRKKTLPVAYALSNASREDRATLETVYGRGAARGEVPVDDILAIFDRTDAKSYTGALAGSMVDRALARLDAAPGAPRLKDEIHTIARYFVGRDR